MMKGELGTYNFSPERVITPLGEVTWEQFVRIAKKRVVPKTLGSLSRAERFDLIRDARMIVNLHPYGV